MSDENFYEWYKGRIGLVEERREFMDMSVMTTGYAADYLDSSNRKPMTSTKPTSKSLNPLPYI
jgi:hypothetical protein